MIEHKPSDSKSASPEETRERILAAARDVMGRKGKRGATTREIAEVAGVNEATLFRHFGNKEALIVATAQFYCGAIELQDTFAALTGPIEVDLSKIGQVMMDRMERLWDLIRWSLLEADYDESVFSKAAWRPQEAILGTLTAYMERGIAAGDLVGNPRELALVYMGMVFSHVMARNKYPGVAMFTEPDRAIQLYIDIFLNGVRSK